jgi:MFS family permease
VLLAILVFVFVRESPFRRPETKVDYVGAALVGGSLALFVLALSEGATWGWLSVRTELLLLLGTALLPPLVWYELRYQSHGGEAIFDLRLIAQRNVMVTNVVGAVIGLGMYAALLSMVYLFQMPSQSGGYGESTFGAGASLVPLALGMLVFAAVAGLLVSRVGTRPMTAFGAAVASTAFLLAIPPQPLGTLLVVEFFIGAGMGIANAGVINLLVLTVNPRDMGLATSLTSVFRNVGSSIGAPLSASLLLTFTVAVLTPFGPVAFPAFLAFQWSFGIAAACFAFAGIFVLFGHEVLGKNAVRRLLDAGTSVHLRAVPRPRGRRRPDEDGLRPEPPQA